MNLGMGMGHHLRPELSHRLTQEIQLSHEVRIETLLALRMELVGALRFEQYHPRGECPKCFRKLTPAEIVRGFNRDVHDFTTACPRCGHRFEPLLICFSDGGQIELPFYCSNQALDQLAGKEQLSPREIARQHPGVYRSLVVHHGSIGKAFRIAGIAYGFTEELDWRSKVQPFLGRMPDTMIADCAGASPKSIRMLRRELGVRPFTSRRLRTEAEERGYLD